MKKIILQFWFLVVLFFSCWFILSEVNWMEFLQVKETGKTTEEKLGDKYWEWFEQSEKEIKSKEITSVLDSIISKICNSNGIDPAQIKLHVVENNEVNAFALPNKHLVIYTGLIAASENEAALSGVISHELAHMEMNHVMKKLIKEAGLSVLVSITTGSSGSDVIKETAKLLSSSAYDRKLEKEADIKAVDYLLKSDIHPEAFANFLYHLANESEAESHLLWISTHPDSKERAEYIIEYYSNKITQNKQVISQNTWNKFKNDLEVYQQ